MTEIDSASPGTHPGRGVSPEAGYRWRLRRADMLEGLAWFSVAVVLALFLADGGWSYFTNIRDVTTGAGIVAGLVGSDLLLVMLLLVARLPVIDRSIGFDRSLAVHRRLGQPVLYLILAHPVLPLLGYGLALGRDPVAEAIAMIRQMNGRPGDARSGHRHVPGRRGRGTQRRHTGRHAALPRACHRRGRLTVKQCRT